MHCRLLPHLPSLTQGPLPQFLLVRALSDVLAFRHWVFTEWAHLNGDVDFRQMVLPQKILEQQRGVCWLLLQSGDGTQGIQEKVLRYRASLSLVSVYTGVNSEKNRFAEFGLPTFLFLKNYIF